MLLYEVRKVGLSKMKSKIRVDNLNMSPNYVEFTVIRQMSEHFPIFELHKVLDIVLLSISSDAFAC